MKKMYGKVIGMVLFMSTITVLQAAEFDVNVDLGYRSKHIAEGVEFVQDAAGVFFSEVTLDWGVFTLGGVFDQGVDDSYNEVNLYLEAQRKTDVLRLYSGVQFLTYPSSDEDLDSWEVYAGVELSLGSVWTPYGKYSYDVVDANGGFLTLGVEAEVPQPVEALTLTPYVEWGLDSGFVSGPRRLSENNLEVGLTVAWTVNEQLELFTSAHHSYALTNLNRERKGDVSWVEAGLTLSF